LDLGSTLVMGALNTDGWTIVLPLENKLVFTIRKDFLDLSSWRVLRAVVGGELDS